MRSSLREVKPPTRTEVNPKFGNALANGLDVAEQAAFQTLDACNYDTAYRRVAQAIEPRGECREWSDREHDMSVIERLHVRQQAATARRQSKGEFVERLRVRDDRHRALAHVGERLGRPRAGI